MRRRRSGSGAAGDDVSLRLPDAADLPEIAALIATLSRRCPDQELTPEGRAAIKAAPGTPGAYRRMGFRPSGPRHVWRGIPGQPMALPLPK